MTLALTFAAPLLLIGLLAAAIPWLLHLLSSVRAQQVYFPTLRFLRLSMEKTARRRRIQHWLLLAVRSLLLAMLCVAVAQPISRATGNWLGGSGGAAAVVLDNSYSMASGEAGGASRLDRARTEASALLGGDERPALASLVTSNGQGGSPQLSSRMDALRESLAKARIAYGPPALGQRVAAVAEALEKDPSSRKAIYVFTDCQRGGLEQLLAMEDLRRHKDVPLLVVDVGRGRVNNVGIADLEISGRRAVDALLDFTARLVNSSPMERVVNVGLRINGRDVGLKARLNLAAAGRDGHIGTAKFRYAFGSAGPANGEVYIEQGDDLPVDNVRRFALAIGGRARVLVVRGGRTADDPWWMDAGGRILVALQPYVDKNVPWPIEPKVVEADVFTPAELGPSVDAAIFSDVPSFTAEQAEAIRDFVRKGGTAMFFMGPSVVEADYNERLAAGPEPLLPGQLAGAVGEVGAAAAAQTINWLDIEHPFLAGLQPAMSDYLTPPLQVQRHFRLAAPAPDAAILARTSDGQPVILCRSLGAGRCVLFTTTSSPRWSNLSSHPLFLPLLSRACLLARTDPWRDATYVAGSQVTIRLPAPAADAEAAASIDISVTPPASGDQSVEPIKATAVRTPEGYAATFAQTEQPGVYRWQAGQEHSGVFAVNPSGAEAQLEAMPAAEFVAAMKSRRMERVYVAPTLAEATARAAAAAEGRNWWDVLAAVAIVLLVAESVIANRRRAQQDAVPAHLNPAVRPVSAR